VAVAVFIGLTLFSAVVFAEELSPAEWPYQAAIELYTEGELEKARAVFDQVNGYRQSRQYIACIDAKTAVKQAAYAEAVSLLEPLAREGFLDTLAYLRYAKALEAEASGDILRAILYYRRLGVGYDALNRLISLQREYPDYFPSELEFPSGAVEGAPAIVMKENEPVFISLNDTRGDSFDQRAEVRALAFRYGAYGALYACVVPMDAPEQDGFDSDLDGDLLYIEAEALFYRTVD
jgi:tetratricopeptide (TPR) repeat protein